MGAWLRMGRLSGGPKAEPEAVVHLEMMGCGLARSDSDREVCSASVQRWARQAPWPIGGRVGYG